MSVVNTRPGGCESEERAQRRVGRGPFTGQMGILVHRREGAHERGRGVTPIFAGIVRAVELPGAGDREKDQGRREEATQIKMNPAPEEHCSI